jgi:Protein of unknown function (DUF2516)
MAEFDFWVFTLLRFFALGVTAWAFIDALIRPATGYVAAGKLTKPAWAAITGIAAVVVYFYGPMSFLGLPAIIAAVVYLVDVRPAVRSLKPGNNPW